VGDAADMSVSRPRPYLHGVNFVLLTPGYDGRLGVFPSSVPRSLPLPVLRRAMDVCVAFCRQLIDVLRVEWPHVGSNCTLLPVWVMLRENKSVKSGGSMGAGSLFRLLGYFGLGERGQSTLTDLAGPLLAATASELVRVTRTLTAKPSRYSD
jgi:hypothetical protein